MYFKSFSSVVRCELAVCMRRCAADAVRMYFKRLIEERNKDIIVVSYSEVDGVELQSYGMVTA